jgi:hypothetical protein
MDNQNSVMNTEEAIAVEMVEDTVEAVEEEPVQIFEEIDQADELVEAEDAEEAVEKKTPADYRQMIRSKCEEVQAHVKGTAARISRDLEETNGNPFFRQTVTYKLEVLRAPDDEEPVDVFVATQVRSFSLCSLALIGAASLLLKNAGEKLLKKLKED